MAEEKSELSSLQDRLKAMRDKQMAMEKEKKEQDQKPKESPAKPAPKDQTSVAPEPKAPPSPAPESSPQDPDDVAARIRERLKKAAASQAAEEQPPQRPEKQADAPTKMPPEPEKQAQDEPQPTAKPENPADRLRALLEKHRQEQQQRASEEDEEEAVAPPRPEPKPAPRPPESIEVPTPAFDPAPAPMFSAPRSAADLYQGYAAPAAPPVRTQPTLRYRLRVGVEKLKKTKIGRLCLRSTSFVMRLTAAGSLLVLVGVSLAFMADRYCSMNDLLLAYCQKGIAPPEACQRDYGMFDVTDGRYWQQLQNYYDYGFVIPWDYVYVMGGHALAALVLGVMGLYHGPRVYRKILRFLTFPLRKLGLFKRL